MYFGSRKDPPCRRVVRAPTEQPRGTSTHGRRRDPVGPVRRAPGPARRHTPAPRCGSAMKGAEVLRPSRRVVLGARKFSYERAQQFPQWGSDAPHIPETELYALSSFVWRADRPVSPTKLAN